MINLKLDWFAAQGDLRAVGLEPSGDLPSDLKAMGWTRDSILDALGPLATERDGFATGTDWEQLRDAWRGRRKLRGKR